MEKVKIKELQQLAKNNALLYVEDNQGLRETMKLTLDKLFDNYTISCDGQEGYNAFKKGRFPIVVTDIDMPRLNGFDMAKKIKELAPETQVIILSSFEDNENLHRAIDIGVSKFLSKPTQLPDLMDALHRALVTIEQKNATKLFQEQLKTMFNYQDNKLLMIKNEQVIMANQAFLDFFGVETIDSFMQEQEDLKNLFEQHENFLYTDEKQHWLETALNDINKLFNVKVLIGGKAYHMLLKIQKIPDEDNYHILSLNDITELDLWNLYKNNADSASQTSSNTVFKMMKILHENKNSIKLLNMYKGITISNEAEIIEVNGDEIVIKTTPAQVKAIKLFKQVTFTSDTFPVSFAALGIDIVESCNVRVVLTHIIAIKKINLSRNKIRVTPAKNHKFTLSTNGFTSMTDSTIIDISIDAVKVRCSDVPFGLKEGTDVNISVILFTQTKPFMINTAATILRMERNNNEVMIVFAFDLAENSYQGLIEYIGSRQRFLIDEFKALALPV
ncbi:MAG: response regulator [Thiovulaceae bacterium]|nr:response regulator [Sulfurimonadaceae bacterium]